MAFVKLDTGMLDSTLWTDREAREIFITALLMATPKEFTDEMEQIAVRDLDMTGYKVPPGWYGYVPAAGPGIVRRSGLEMESGMKALERLGDKEIESRTPDFEGRRMIRVDGGFLILNYMLYRERDYTSAIRQKRYREKKKLGVNSNGVTTTLSHRDATLPLRNITHAEAEAEAEAEVQKENTGQKKFTPPSIEEVLLIGAKAGLPEPESRKFHAFYESKGWMVGKNRMKSLNGAIAGWRLRWQETAGPASNGQSTPIQPRLHTTF